MLKIIQKLKDNWAKSHCEHKRVLETDLVRSFTIGDNIHGVIPLFICIDCKKKIHQTINN